MSAKVTSPTLPPPASQPWGKVNNTEVIQQTTSLSDVMDEQYALQLQADEEKKVFQDRSTDEIVQTLIEETTPSTTETDNDLLLAQMLQLEFDKENDKYIKSMEKNYNGSSKISMSFKNYQALHPYDDVEDVDSESDDDDDLYFDEEVKRLPAYKGEIITKHDSFNTERKNANNAGRLPMNSGDVSGKDIRLPNNVYNKLKTHSQKQERSEMRVHDKHERSTHEQALDENTRLIIYKMVNNGTLNEMNGIISTGKEAVVIHASGGDNEDHPTPKECALKVFKTTLNEFKTRHKYIKDDHRFKDRFAHQNPRKIIKLWAEKEFRNLSRMCEAGINCPRVVMLRKHILVMSFIGDNQTPAPKLKDAMLSKTQLQSAYKQCVEIMKTMYEKCDLIHADFSEYNILWHDNQCHVIDVSQSIQPIHPHAFHFLARDCQNVVTFFSKKGVSDVMTKAELFNHVSGKDVGEIDQVEKEYQLQFEKDKELVTFGIDLQNSSSFEYQFQQTSKSQDALQSTTPSNTQNATEVKLPEDSPSG